MSSKGSDAQTVTNTVDIPEFLQPFLNQSASAASGALSGLQNALRGDQVAGFNPLQQQGQDLAVQRALGSGGFLDAASQQFLNTAQGQQLSNFLPQAALDTFSQGTQGFLPQGSQNALQGLSQGQIPPALQSILNGTNIPGTDFLSQQAQGQQLDPASISALQQTANGDFLFGGDGFNAAVDAATRSARPGIQSAFGQGGAGAATGGLAQAAIAQSGQDAFARQFAQERGNQLNASNSLAQLGLAGNQQRLGAASNLANVGLANQGQQLQGINSLFGGQLGALSQLQGQGNQRLGAAGQLAGLGNSERNRQLQAASALPGLSQFAPGVLQGIGGLQQGQAQRELSGPAAAFQQLLGSSLGGLPVSSFLGQTQTTPTQSNPLAGALGGAAAGFSLFPTPFGALGGGLLGGILG